jgi:hypothetical protein
MAMPSWRGHLPLLGGMAVANHRGGGTHHWDVNCYLPASHFALLKWLSFKISSEGRQFLSQLTKDQESKVSGSAPHYLYH